MRLRICVHLWFHGASNPKFFIQRQDASHSMERRLRRICPKLVVSPEVVYFTSYDHHDHIHLIDFCLWIWIKFAIKNCFSLSSFSHIIFQVVLSIPFRTTVCVMEFTRLPVLRHKNRTQQALGLVRQSTFAKICHLREISSYQKVLRKTSLFRSWRN